MDRHSEMKVLIIGAGTTGLLIAQGLKKAGINFEIFERAPAAYSAERDRDWSMALHWGSSHFRPCLSGDIFSKIDVIQCDPYYGDVNGDMPDIEFRDGESGELIHSIPGKGVWRVSRKKMRILFAEGLDVQWGKRLVAITSTKSSITATFEDGTIKTGTHLVGADGAKSLVRTILLGDKAALTPLPYTIFNFKVQFTAEQARFFKENPKFHPIMNFGINDKMKALGMFVNLDLTDREKPETWIWQVLFSVQQDDLQLQKKVVEMSSEEKLEWLKGWKGVWTDPWKSALEWIPEGTQVPADVCMLWKDPVEWPNHNGHITLAGDAAHAVPPHRAQGLNHAIQDAAKFVAAMRKIKDGMSSEEAIGAYDEELLERGTREINVSYATTKTTHGVKTLREGPMGKIGVSESVRQVEGAAAV